MADKYELKAAEITFNALCGMLDERGWNYDVFKEEFTITCGAKGDDLPINIMIRVSPEKALVTLISKLDFKVTVKEKIPEVAVAISAINLNLADGSFDFDMLRGSITFRMTNSYRSSLLGKELFEYMLFVSCFTVDDYNDKLLKLINNEMTLKEFLNFVNEEE